MMSETEEPTIALKMKEAAALLDVDVRQLRDDARSGTVPARLIGSQYIFGRTVIGQLAASGYGRRRGGIITYFIQAESGRRADKDRQNHQPHQAYVLAPTRVAGTAGLHWH